MPPQQAGLSRAMYTIPIRATRLAAWELNRQPTALQYRPLAANYQDYWMPDSDAVSSIDMFEAYLWFRSRAAAR